MEKRTKLHFGYGSNLNEQDWHRWCGKNNFDTGLLKPVCKATVRNMTLAFTVYSGGRKGGVLDLLPCEGSTVEGVLFEVMDGGWEALNEKEGAPNFYHQVEVEATTANGDTVQAITYVVCENRRAPTGYVKPSEEDYLKVVRAGYEVHGIDTQALEAAANPGKQ